MADSWFGRKGSRTSLKNGMSADIVVPLSINESMSPDDEPQVPSQGTIAKPQSTALPMQWQSRLQDLNERQRACALDIESQLHQVWALGRNIILSWAVEPAGIMVLALPHYQITQFITAQGLVPTLVPVYFGDRAVVGMASGKFVSDLLTGSRCVKPEQIVSVAKLMGVAPVHVQLSHPDVLAELNVDIVDMLVKRHSMSYRTDCAVALFDIAKFSLYTPLEQMTLLNSLAYSLNSAHAKLLGRHYQLDFARSTTGDGFYIWNRDTGAESNKHLYHLMQLTLADNAIALGHSKGKNTAPKLKAAFHVGSCYEFYQYEALHPTPYNYIVGDVTIELARLIDGAMPGQILVGDFRTTGSYRGDDGSSEAPSLTAPRFIQGLQDSLSNLRGMRLSGDEVESIRCYLTGPHLGNDNFDITRLRITDKHGLSRIAFNAKVNIYRQGGRPIFLGLRHADLVEAGAKFA